MEVKEFQAFTARLKELDSSQLDSLQFHIWTEFMDREYAREYAEDEALTAMTGGDEGPTSYDTIRGE